MNDTTVHDYDNVDIDTDTDDMTDADIARALDGQIVDQEQLMHMSTNIHNLVDVLNRVLSQVHYYMLEYLLVCKMTGTKPLFRSYIDLATKSQLPLRELRMYSHFPDKLQGKYKPHRKQLHMECVVNKYAYDTDTIISPIGESWCRFADNYQEMVKHGIALIKELRDKNDGNYTIPAEVDALRAKLTETNRRKVPHDNRSY